MRQPVPIDEGSTWASGAPAHELIAAAQADPGLSRELEDAFQDTTDQLRVADRAAD